MITATERADWMALQVLISARLHNARVVTHDLVDAVMSRDANKECGKANKATVRRIIRKQAASEGVRVIFTDDERYWAIRERLYHMAPADVSALVDSIAEGGDDDPCGWDRVLIGAISNHRSNRPSPRRLWGCKPVSIRLWREPRTAAEERPAPTEGTAPAAAAPRFAALVAYESARDASLSVSPRELDDLAAHLIALGPAAPAGLHTELVDAHGDIEEAREALRTARSLTSRNAAIDQARAAVERARAVILAIEPHAKQMRGTDMPVTADDIRAAARAYNAVGGAPEELSAIETGTPAVQVWCRNGPGLGREVIVHITAGVRADIGHIPAHSPIVLRFRRLDGRMNAAENARRLLWRVTPAKRYLRVEDVPVEFLQDSRG